MTKTSTERLAKIKAWVTSHRDLVHATQKRWRINHKEEIKAYRLSMKAEMTEYFQIYNATKRDKVKSREQKKLSMRRSRLLNPEHHKQLQAASRLNNLERYRLVHAAAEAKRRALKRQCTAGVINYQDIIDRDNNICGICHKKVLSTQRSFDHIVPLILSGPHMESNLQLTHRHCNYSKGVGRLPSQMRLPLVEQASYR